MASALVFDADTEMLRRVMRQFVDEAVEPRAHEFEATGQIPADIVAEARDLGLFGLAIPEEYDGLGLSMTTRCAVYQELSRGPAALTSLVGGHGGIGTSGIVALGSAEQKRRYLPRMATGELIGCFALSEPDAGSDAAAIRTRAVKKGDRYVLNGLKHFITNGPSAGVATVIAVTDPSKGTRGMTAFLVEPDFPGYHVGASDKKMGLWGSETAELIFTDCAVPEENRLGPEGEGYRAALRILADGRAQLAARCVGQCYRAIELSVEHARTRIAFGKPIGEQQAVQMMLADMQTETTAAELLTYHVAAKVDHGERVVAEAAMAKLYASEVLGRIADLAVQIFGGMGYMRECAVERIYRDARVTRIYEGTSEIQRQIIARGLLSDR